MSDCFDKVWDWPVRLVSPAGDFSLAYLAWYYSVAIVGAIPAHVAFRRSILTSRHTCCLHSCSLLEGCHNIHSHLGLIFLKSGQVQKKTEEKGIEKQMREGKKMKWGERRKDKELQMKVSMNHLTRRAQRDLARREGGTVACLAPF